MPQLLILAFLCSTLSVRTPDYDSSTTNDERFLKRAAISAMTEVRLGELAIQRTDSQPIRDFARRMVTSYSLTTKEIRELADRKGIACPSHLDGKHKQIVEDLAQLTAPGFNRAYMAVVIETHEQDIGAFESHGATGCDADIRDWISSTLPKLREHLQVARETRRQTDVGTDG